MSKQKIGRDNWLYILTNAITNYVEEGGEAQVASDPAAGAITVRLCQVRPGDRRLHPEFVALLALGREGALTCAEHSRSNNADDAD
jgi:hypothetical protein